jgi:hypothetical protein
MLIPITTDLHLDTLRGVEDVDIPSTMAFCGLCEGSRMLQVTVIK